MINFLVRPTFSRLETYSVVGLLAAMPMTSWVDVLKFAVIMGCIGLLNDTLYKSAIGKDR